MKTFGWAFIGCGGIAQITAKELLQTGRGEIVAAWNRTPERAAEFVKNFGGKACATAEEAMQMSGVDGVYIAVTANMHAYYMQMAIQFGKPVLCEKPFTVNAVQAEAIFAEAAQAGVYVSEAMWTWHNATALHVKNWVNSGAIGSIKRVNCTYSFPLIRFSKKERHTSPEMIGGALLDIGVYGIRYCYELFGMPKDIICKGRVVNGIDLGEEITLVYDSFSAHFIFSRDQNHGETFEIEGELGEISVPMFHMARKASMSGPVRARVRDKNLLYGSMFTNVAKEITSGAAEGHYIPAQTTVDCLKILDECRRQMGLKYPCETE